MELPKHTFAVIPISNVLARVDNRLLQLPVWED
jgi:hypothetical protein